MKENERMERGKREREKGDKIVRKEQRVGEKDGRDMKEEREVKGDREGFAVPGNRAGWTPVEFTL